MEGKQMGKLMGLDVSQRQAFVEYEEMSRQCT